MIGAHGLEVPTRRQRLAAPGQRAVAAPAAGDALRGTGVSIVALGPAGEVLQLGEGDAAEEPRGRRQRRGAAARSRSAAAGRGAADD